MYLIVIAWFYVTLMMALAEASSPMGSMLGAMVTFVLYGMLPMGILIYILGTPQRKHRLKVQREIQQRAWDEAQQTTAIQATSAQPNGSSHAPGTTQNCGITPVGEKH